MKTEFGDRVNTETSPVMGIPLIRSTCNTAVLASVTTITLLKNYYTCLILSYHLSVPRGLCKLEDRES